ncbi:4-(cytidine 5'-diphospho)-2-C-methyl-D-erythritol kinase [Rhodoferax aquaticus]|uniref:4-diphosphocytidyl-2-C-methyl-D-erythritol kinase n=1 Tax=Rhodoferax aquaticus TaxID=2527691 RepID=A0A515ELL7_9BURK|nr:4-(cytidine 5'-diphospho)-2-C-methyl-D-erythritol kinase [Rhodoferax aquaticus]QDL53557.1 4-(cytidine 5'-diphospho)-2-C-methyl-D-erythritol kinase [Rhodoferax aquaticus]
MQSLYDIPAPAKLNLFLHITGRRADGYHLLQSVFMLIDWSDTLHIDVRADGHISREDLSSPLPADDLIIRAAKALQQHSHCPLGAHIGIEKSIPAQAGMGGGSSDAASTLLALNKLWGLDLPLSTLHQIGLSLGADIPFFLHGTHAWVEGIGEQLTSIDLPNGQFAVAKPEEGLETQKIFSDCSLKRDTEPAIISGFAADAFGYGQNDLQAVAEKLCPSITRTISWLASKGLNAKMTGSGSAVFAHSLSEVDLCGAPSGTQARICNVLEVHPLYGWATRDGL